MSLDEGVSNLIKRIYSAGAKPDEWGRVSEQVLQFAGGCSGLTTVVDLHRPAFEACKTYGRAGTQVALALEEYTETYALDPTLRWASENPTARFCDSRLSTPADEYLTSDFVKWNAARMGATHWYVGFSAPTQQLSYSFSVHFPKEQGPGKPEDVALFRLLFDHLDCAVRLNRRPFNPETSRALILLDGQGYVLHLSDGAATLLGRRGALTVSSGRLTTAQSQDQVKLDKMLTQVASACTTGAGPAAIAVAHPSGKKPWIVAVRPLVESFGPFGRVQCSLMVEVHEGVPKIGSIQLLQSLFHLSAKELEVVRLLADGHSIESLAEQISISPNTVRTHLRSIFAKTSTSRQSELLQLCAGLAQP